MPATHSPCNKLLRQLLLWVTLALSAHCAMGQTGTGEVTGIITDPSGALVPAAVITLSADTPLGTPAKQGSSILANVEGSFRIPGLSPGKYTLTVQAHGFGTAEQTLEVQAGHAMHLIIALKIDIQRQQIAVSGDSLDSNPEHNLTALVFKGSTLDVLSSDPQQLQLQVQAMAGSASGTQLFVDGFTATRMPPKSSIREIRINEDPFSAQYDTTGSGRVEIFTQPGGDSLHGTLTLLGEDSALNSQNPYVQEQPPYSSFFTEGNVSGPLTKASSWFLAGDEQNVGEQSFIHAITSTTGPAYTATVSSPRQSTDVAPRLDFQIGKIQTLSLRYQFGHQSQDDLLQSQLSLQSQAIDTRHTDQTFQVSDTQSYGEHVINETRFQFLHTNDSSVSLEDSPSIQVQGAFNGGGNNLGQSHDGQNHYELQNYTSIALSKHLLRFGGRFRDVQDGNTSTAGFNGQFIFPSIESYQITTQGLANGLTPAQIRAAGGGASQFALTTGNPKASVNVADVGLFFEDDWKMTPNMTLSPGIRFESQTDIHDHADFGPRLSYAWAIGAGPETAAKAVLRAGIGIFYDRFPSDQVLNAARQNGILQQQYVVNFPDFYPKVPPVDSLGPATLPTIFQISPLLHAPYTVQHSVSLDKEFFKRLSVSVDYTYYRGVDQLLTRNINAPLPGTYNPADPSSGVRPLGTLQNIYQYESEGASKKNRILASFRLNTRPLQLFGYYIYGYSNSNTGGPTSFPSNQYDLHDDYGRAVNDNRNRFYLGGVTNLPFQFQLYPFLILQSNLPFNITVGNDLNGDSQFNDRPAFATNLSRPSVYVTKWGTFDAAPLPGQTIIPINYGTGPSVAMLNLSLSRNLGFGPRSPDQPASSASGSRGTQAKTAVVRRYQANLGIQVQNVFNTVNGGTPVGVLGSSLFGESTSLSSTQFSSQQANRILYLHLRLNF
jgi:Carboxypeptidase regulatory-like domain